MSTQHRKTVTWLILFAFGRLILISGRRILFPFLPEIARGLGISIVEMQQLIGWTALISLVAPFLVPLNERLGRKPLIIGGYVIFILAAIIATITANAWLFALSMGLVMLSHTVHDPNMQAYIGDMIPWEWRGRATGLIEISWSLSLLLIAPIAAVLIGRYGWRSPFVMLAVLGVVFAWCIQRTVPAIPPEKNGWTTPRQMWRYVRQYPAVWAASGFALLVSGSNQLLFVSYAAWMEETFTLSLDGLGLTAIVIGAAELVGEIIMGFGSDRFGKKTVILIAGIIAAVCYVIIPSFDTSLPVALLVMFVLFVAFEATFISIIPIFSELIPPSRTTALSALAASGRLGRSAAAFLVAPIGQAAGFGGITIVAAVLTVIGVLLVVPRRDIAN